jgi:hypothetical protein
MTLVICRWTHPLIIQCSKPLYLFFCQVLYFLIFSRLKVWNSESFVLFWLQKKLNHYLSSLIWFNEKINVVGNLSLTNWLKCIKYVRVVLLKHTLHSGMAHVQNICLKIWNWFTEITCPGHWQLITDLEH